MSPERIPDWVVYPGLVIGAISALACAVIAVVIIAVEVAECVSDRHVRRRVADHNRQDALTAPLLATARTVDSDGEPFDEAAWLQQWGIGA